MHQLRLALLPLIAIDGIAAPAMNVASTVVNPIQRHGLKRAICHRRFPQRTMAISHGDKKQGYVPFSARRSQIGLLIPRVFPNKNVRGISGGGSTTNLPEWTAEDDQVVGDIKGEIEQAIQRGAPVFNDGDPGGCCKIYLESIHRIRDMAGKGGSKYFTVMYKTDQLLVQIRKFESRLNGKTPQEDDYVQIAWTLRNVLEFIVNHVTKMQTSLKEAGGSTTSSEDGTMTLFDFSNSDNQAAILDSWFSMNDVVMGGSSTGALVAGDNKDQNVDGSNSDDDTHHEPKSFCAFKGVLSSAGNGGFASIRSKEISTNLGDFEGLELGVVKGDNRVYKLSIVGPASEFGVVYQADFHAPVTESGKETGKRVGADIHKIRIPFSSFKPSVMGRSVDVKDICGSDVRQIGLMVSKLTDEGTETPEFKYGPFELQLSYLKAYPSSSKR